MESDSRWFKVWQRNRSRHVYNTSSSRGPVAVPDTIQKRRRGLDVADEIRDTTGEHSDETGRATARIRSRHTATGSVVPNSIPRRVFSSCMVSRGSPGYLHSRGCLSRIVVRRSPCSRNATFLYARLLNTRDE